MGCLYAGIALYAIFAVEATFSADVANSWLEAYVSSFVFDFFIIMLVRTVFSTLLVIYMGATTGRKGLTTKLVLLILDKNILVMLA